ncbi:MAG: hypothetical protein HRT71_18545 [Flavobacteriales bacterium]|nr:hypothetical protein [Flavobacteriales bacterium]
MNHFLKSSLLILLISTLLIGCAKEQLPSLTPTEMLVGKWEITSTVLFDAHVSGDGSFLQFESCNTTCDGIDFNGASNTAGNFTYVLSDDATSLVIDDKSNDGLTIGYTWEVTELSNSNLSIKTSTMFGDYKIYLTK